MLIYAFPRWTGAAVMTKMNHTETSTQRNIWNKLRRVIQKAFPLAAGYSTFFPFEIIKAIILTKYP